MEDSKIVCTPRYRLYPTEAQREQIDITLSGCRFAYNRLLFSHEEAFEKAGIYPSYYELCKELPAMKQEFPQLQAADSSALQAATKNLSRAYKSCAVEIAHGNRDAAPRHKREDDYLQSYRSSNRGDCISLSGDCVKIPKVGLVKIRLSKPVEGRIVAATITREGRDKYFISFCIELAKPPLPLPKTGKMVGLDLGLHTYVVTSDGDGYHVEDLKARYQGRMDKLYERLRRQTKGSKRWHKTHNQLHKLRRRIARKRKDTLDKLSMALIRQYDVIFIENLAIQNLMQQNFKKTAIRNAAWGEFCRMLEYKAAWYGRRLIKVNRYFPSSQLCSNCGYQERSLRDSHIRYWTCPNCGSHHDRDANAAVNILNEGLRMLS